MIHTRSAGPPDAPSGPADDAASALARTSAWIGEARPVLAAIETELRRTDEVRRRWDASAGARREGPPPGAVVALIERRTELAHHRDALRATMAAISSAPATDSALASAWPQLRAAQEMLRALVSRRGELGDPVETEVSSLLDQESSDASGGPPASRGDVGRVRGGVEDTVTLALAATTAEPTDPVSGAVEEAVPTAGPVEADEAAESGSDTEGIPEQSTDQVLDAPASRTILTFGGPSTGAADPEPLEEEEVSPVADVPTDDDTGEEASVCQHPLAERSDRCTPTARASLSS